MYIYIYICIYIYMYIYIYIYISEHGKNIHSDGNIDLPLKRV